MGKQEMETVKQEITLRAQVKSLEEYHEQVLREAARDLV